MKKALLLVIAAALSSFPAHSQTPPTPSPQSQFEVASIRMAAPYTEEEVRSGAANNPWSTFPTNRFTAQRLTLKLLVGLAYGVDQQYIQGDPDWLNSQHYSIEAKVEGNKELTYDQIKPLLQHLLEQRFHLTTHRVTKLTSGYALIVARGGPKLTPGKEGITPHAYIVPNGVQAQGMDMAHFVPILSHPVGYPVVDKTGITGNYDIKLSYAPANDPNSNLPDLFTALQEQLGLKLESQKVLVEILVIDHVDRIPTEN